MVRQRAKDPATLTIDNAKGLYTLEVFIINGPITRRFAKNNRVISRTIQILADQTPEDLHHAIFEAFDREEEHLYEFQIGGEGPMDPKARRCVLPVSLETDVSDSKPAGDVMRTTMASPGLNIGDASGYWFGFGDDWWHQINVIGIEEKRGRAKFPKVIKRVGKSPPQYVDWDEAE
jgi:hypothetical protein